MMRPMRQLMRPGANPSPRLQWLPVVAGTIILGTLMIGCGETGSSSTPEAASSSDSTAQTSADHTAGQPSEDRMASKSGGATGTGSSSTAGDAADSAPTTLPHIDLPRVQQLIQQTAASDQVLVIDFWATWCAPCVAMFADLHEAIKSIGEDARIVSITLDGPGEGEAAAVRFLKKHHALKDAYLLKPESREAVVQAIGKKWQALEVPAILVFNAQGELAGEFLQQEATVPNIQARVRELTQSSSARSESSQPQSANSDRKANHHGNAAGKAHQDL